MKKNKEIEEPFPMEFVSKPIVSDLLRFKPVRDQSVGVIGEWHQEILTSEFSDVKKSIIRDL